MGDTNPLAIIDIGSNSARLVIYQRERGGQLRILASARAVLRLVRDVDKDRRLSPESVRATLRVLSDFSALIKSHGTIRTLAVATAAMRDAENGPVLIAKARRDLGLRIELIDARREAYYGALGGIRALPVESGVLFDLGGGTIQIVGFKDRKPGMSHSLPLGSLRLNQSFLRHDPPTKREVRTLRRHVEKQLASLKLPALRPNHALVGVGGTVRNLAKVDARLRNYPIARVHGYVLSRQDLTEIVNLFCSQPLRSNKSVAGLSRERGDSIVGGSLVIQMLVEILDADSIIVSGEGVREGLAYSLHERILPGADDVRTAAILSLAARFTTWDRKWALRRAGIVANLLKQFKMRVHSEIRSAAQYAAMLLDIGRSLDFFDRYEHAAGMVMDTELDGFSHNQIALLSAIIANAGDEDVRPHSYNPLLDKYNHDDIECVAMVLRLADEIHQRSPRGRDIRIKCRITRREVTISGVGLGGWTLRGVGPRFQRLFGRELKAKSF